MFHWLMVFLVLNSLIVGSQAEDEISEKKNMPGEKMSKSGKKDPGEKEGKTEEAGETATPKEDDVSAIQVYLEPMVYNRKTRDPFEKPAVPLKMGQIYGPFLELQNYNLDRFILKGLIWKTRNPKAIFRGPDNKEYRLTIKDYIGENFGYIAAIREREVVIIQTVEENNKKYSATKVVFLKN